MLACRLSQLGTTVRRPPWSVPYTPRVPNRCTPEHPRVALVHDFLLDVRGAERVFLELCGMWPDADIFTAVYDERGTEGRFAGRRVHSSFLQTLRPTARTFRALLPLYPAAIESFDLSGYDLVVSSSSAWAHAVLCDEHTIHVSYCHNPFRYAWNDRERTLARAAQPVHPRVPARSCSGAGASGTGSRRSEPTATSRTRAPPRPGSAPTSAASRTIVHPPGRHLAILARRRSETTTRSSPS